jgi:hypothetical protein
MVLSRRLCEECARLPLTVRETKSYETDTCSMKAKV